MTSLDAPAEKSVEKDLELRREFTLLKKSGIIELFSNEANARSFLRSLIPEEASEGILNEKKKVLFGFLTRANGILKDTKKRERTSLDGGNVGVSSERGDIAYLPPSLQDKADLLWKAFECARGLPLKDAGLLIYYSIQAIHPFSDANGRTGRLMYLLAEAASKGEPLSEETIKRFLSHADGEETRQRFEQRVASPESIYPTIEYFVALAELGDTTVKGKWKIYGGFQSGVIENYENPNLLPSTKEKLNNVMAESNQFSLSSVALLAYLKRQGIEQKYRIPPRDEKDEAEIYKFDGMKVLLEISDAGAKEVVNEYYRLKNVFVETLFDAVVNPEKYRFEDDGSTVKSAMEEQTMISIPNSANRRGGRIPRWRSQN